MDEMKTQYEEKVKDGPWMENEHPRLKDGKFVPKKDEDEEDEKVEVEKEKKDTENDEE